MPHRKSAISLKNLCLTTLCQNLNTLQHKAKCLPKPVINELSDVWHEYYRYHFVKHVYNRKHMLPPYPADLLLHSRTKTINKSDFAGQNEDEIIGKISRLCKKLRKIKLLDIHHINAITINNPHILEIDLLFSKITDEHLFIIGKHCPKLLDLSLLECEHITDKGIYFLPEKIEALYLPDHISLVNALEHFPQLRKLNCETRWHEVFERYAKSLANGVCNRTYRIEELDLSLSRPTIYDIPHTVGTLFPEVRKIYFDSTYLLGSTVELCLKAMNYKLITYLNVYVSVEFIQIIMHLCPSLEVLGLNIGLQIQTIDNQYLGKPKNVPFKYLRKLRIRDGNSNLSMDDLTLLVANCKQLESLSIVFSDWLSDQVIYGMLSVNPLKCVKRVRFERCGPFSIAAVGVLLKSLDSLTRLWIIFCRQISLEDQVTTSNLIREMNWDLDLKWEHQRFASIIQ